MSCGTHSGAARRAPRGANRSANFSGTASRAETETHHTDALRLHLGAGGEKAHGRFGVFDLLQANHAAARALAVAATAHVKAQRHIAELFKQRRCHYRYAAIFIAAKAVQHHDGGALFTRLHVIGQMQHPGQTQTIRYKRYLLLHSHSPRPHGAAALPEKKASAKLA